MIDKRILFVKQVRICSGVIRYEIIKTRNMVLSKDTKIGHRLTEVELMEYLMDSGWEVEIT